MTTRRQILTGLLAAPVALKVAKLPAAENPCAEVLPRGLHFPPHIYEPVPGPRLQPFGVIMSSDGLMRIDFTNQMMTFEVEEEAS